MTGLALHSSVPKCPETNNENEYDDDDIDDDDEDEDEDDVVEEDDDFEDDFSDEDDDDDEEDLKENIKRKKCDTDEEKDDEKETCSEIKELENTSNAKPCTSGSSSSSGLSSKAQTENLYKKLKTSSDVTNKDELENEATRSDEVNRDDDGDSRLSTPKCYLEVRRWKQGAYTLVNDDDEEIKARALDLMVFFKCKLWSLECGGNVSYLARDEDNEVCIFLLIICY